MSEKLNNVSANYEDEMIKYVGANSNYYKDIFSKIKNENKSKFNWSAALFSGCWLFYRKLYKEGIIAWGTILLITCLLMTVHIKIYDNVIDNALALGQRDQVTEIIATRGNIANIILWVIIAIASILIASIGNRLYFKKIEKLHKEQKPNKSGKTSLISAIVAYICIVILLLIVDNFVTHALIQDSITMISERFLLPIFEIVREIVVAFLDFIR